MPRFTHHLRRDGRRSRLGRLISPILAVATLAAVLFGPAPAALADAAAVADQGSPPVCQGPGVEIVTPLVTVSRTASVSPICTG